MKLSDVKNCLGYTIAVLLGMLIASYYPLPGINHKEIYVDCPEEVECPVGFATFEEMRFLVEELRICRERK